MRGRWAAIGLAAALGCSRVAAGPGGASGAVGADTTTDSAVVADAGAEVTATAADAGAGQDAAADATASVDAAPTADTADAGDATVDAGTMGDVSADAGDSTGNGQYTVVGGCAVPWPIANPACATVSCASGQTCMGKGLCLPDATTLLDAPTLGQNAPSIATRAGGGWAIAWFDGSIDKGQMDAWLAVSTQGDAKLGPPLQLSVDKGVFHRTPSLVSLVDGSWLAIWRVEDEPGNTLRFQGRRIAPDGQAALGPPVQLNDVELGLGTGGSNVDGPLAVRLRNGKVLVAWPGKAKSGATGLAVHARLLDATGVPEGPELDTGAVFPGAMSYSPGIAALPQGGSLLVWQTEANKTVTVQGRRFDANGQPIGPLMLLSPVLQPYEAMPNAVAFEAGQVLLTWKAAPQASSTGPVDVMTRRIAILGSGAGPILLAGQDPSGVYPDQAPTALLTGNRAAIVWHSADLAQGGVFLRRYYPDDDVLDCVTTEVAGPLLPGEAGERHRPMVAGFDDGRTLVAWATNTNQGIRVALRFLP